MPAQYKFFPDDDGDLVIRTVPTKLTETADTWVVAAQNDLELWAWEREARDRFTSKELEEQS